jgi:hypothetical protein
MNEKTIHIFIGPGPKVGKTFQARKFAQEHSLKAGSTSDVVMERLAQELEHIGLEHLADFGCWEEDIKEYKDSFRWLLQAVGDRMCKENPLALAGKLIENGCTVVDGIRRQEELDKVLKAHPNHRVYYVTRPGHPKEKDNTDIVPCGHNWVHIDNSFE